MASPYGYHTSILPGISDHDIVQIQVNTSANNLFAETTVYIPIQEGKLGWDEAGTRSLPSGHA